MDTRLKIVILIAGFSGFLLSACRKDSLPEPTPPPATITPTPEPTPTPSPTPTPTPDQPAITSTTTAQGQAGQAFSYQITATNNPANFGAANLPAGLSVNSGTGLISGTPTQAGSSQVTLSATNAGGTGTAILALTINSAPSPSPSLVIYDDDLQNVGGAYLYPDPGFGNTNIILNFFDTTLVVSGNAISYYWNGGSVGSGGTIWNGFNVAVAEVQNYPSTPAKDLRSGNYTKVTFDAAANLTSGVMVKVEAAANPSIGNTGACVMLSSNGTLTDGSCNNLAQVNSTYSRYTLFVTSAQLSSVKDYFKATFIKPGGNGSGGKVYFDNISYQQ